jgi:predicted secreted protein
MSITSAIVLFAVIWFMVLFIVLPIGLRTQGEAGNVAPGTPSSAPSETMLKRKMQITTAVTVVLFAIIAGVIVSGMVTVSDLDVFHRMAPDR